MGGSPSKVTPSSGRLVDRLRLAADDMIEARKLDWTEVLVCVSPLEARRTDQDGAYPLHLAVATKATSDVVKALLSAYPPASKIKWKGKASSLDRLPPPEFLNDFNMPLHIAVAKSASLDVLRALLEAWPEAISERSDNHELPLHIALRIRAAPEIVEFLLQAHPEAAAAKQYEDYPLHIAVKENSSKQNSSPYVIELLTKAFPKATLLEDVEGRVPLEIAASSPKTLPAVLATLVLADLPISSDPECADPVEEHGHSWSIIIAKSTQAPAKWKPVIEAVFKAQPSVQHCLALAHSKDRNHRTVFNLATHEVQQIMTRYMFFCGRYELQHGPPIHRSATAVVIAATDHSLPGKPRVALKLMKHEEQMLREGNVRNKYTLDTKFVVGLLEGPPASVIEQGVKELRLQDERSLEEFKFGLVMPFASRSLDAIFRQERPDLAQIKAMMLQVAEALQHCHDRGVAHCDIKTLNVVRVEDRMCLIDMDASGVIGKDFVGTKFSSGVLPPEMFYELKTTESIEQYKHHFREVEWQKHEPMDNIVVKAFVIDSNDPLPYERVVASPAVDVWAFGALLFLLCTGEPLLSVNRDDDLVDGTAMRQAANWSDVELQRKINDAPIDGESRLVRDLLKIVLRASASDRASIQNIIHHPFFTGVIPARLSSEAGIEYDVFISYRFDSDKESALLLHRLLQERKLRVYLDSKSLVSGLDWEVGFCDGLIKSRCFLPLISKPAIEKKFAELELDSQCDNVLLEYRLAVELQSRGLIERIFPVFLGDPAPNDEGGFVKYLPAHTAAKTHVELVESKLKQHLDRQGLGAPLATNPSVARALDRIKACQGGFIEGPGSLEALLAVQADKVRDMVASLGRATGSELDKLRRRIKRLNQRLVDAGLPVLSDNDEEE